MRNALCHGGGSVRNALCHGGGPGAGLCATRCVMAGPVAQRVVSPGPGWGRVCAQRVVSRGRACAQRVVCHGVGGGGSGWIGASVVRRRSDKACKDNASSKWL